jgi:hypothetical protein
MRAQFFLLAWYLKYSLGRSQEDKIQKEVYRETIRWHFSKDARLI